MSAEIVKRIVASEERYVHKVLETLCNAYLHPLRARSKELGISPHLLAETFSVIESLCDEHRSLLADLTADEAPSPSVVGGVFQRFAPKLESTAVFVASFPEVIRALSELRSVSSVAAAIDDCAAKSDCEYVL